MDLSRLCRSCMKEVASWERENFSQRLVDMFCFCTDIKIDNDILPRQFCYNCVIRIESTYTFIIESQRIDMHYKTILTEMNTGAIIENDPYNKNPAFLGFQPSINPVPVNSSPYFKEVLEDNDVPSSVLENDPNYQMNSELELTESYKNDALDRELNQLCRRVTKNMKAHEKRKCPKCPKTFAIKSWFVKHLRSEHGGRKVDHTCPQCSKTFSKRALLTQHISLHTTEKLYECDICAKSYKLKKQLASHMKTHTEERPYICDHCSMSFKLKCILKNHMRVHQIRRYLCCECGIAFVHLGNLSIHMRVHTGLKPYECSDCGFKSNTKSSLTRHILKHKGTRPHTCRVCGKTFRDSGSLIRHNRLHTGECPFKCPHCELSFSDSWKRKTHLMKRHQYEFHQIPKMARDGTIIES